MTTQKIVTVVKDEHGEWEGIYLDGELWTEGHSLSNFDWIELMNNFHLGPAEIKYVNAQWMVDQGTLPKDIKDISDGVFVWKN